jgi:hypothetical protein
MKLDAGKRILYRVRVCRQLSAHLICSVRQCLLHVLPFRDVAVKGKTYR